MLFAQGLKINGLQFRGNGVSMLIYSRFYHSKSEEDMERDWRGKFKIQEFKISKAMKGIWRLAAGCWRGREEIQDSRIQD
jgi:hypothetical protein